VSDDAAVVDDAAMLKELMAVRGVRAAALVGVDGDFLSGEASDEGLLERMVSTLTSALAAGEALAGLMARPATARPTHGADASADEGPADEEETAAASEHDAGQRQLMVMYQDGGPILFTPLPGGERVAVVALSSSHDIGRARFELRGLTNAGS